jgi:hypothetical protein
MRDASQVFEIVKNRNNYSHIISGGEIASLAQLVELLLCKERVVGSNPTGSSKEK